VYELTSDHKHKNHLCPNLLKVTPFSAAKASNLLWSKHRLAMDPPNLTIFSQSYSMSSIYRHTGHIPRSTPQSWNVTPVYELLLSTTVLCRTQCQGQRFVLPLCHIAQIINVYTESHLWSYFKAQNQSHMTASPVSQWRLGPSIMTK